MALSFRKPDPLRIEGDVVENIRTFRKDLGQYFLANKTWNKRRETQVARLLNLMDEDALLVYYTLDVSRTRDATVDDILNAFEDYFLPQKNTTAQIIKFLDRTQDPKEPFDEYLADLKSLIPSCRFGVHEKRLLVAQTIRGLKSKMAKSDLMEKEMTLEQVIAYCKTYEITEETCRLCLEESGIPILEPQQRKFVLVRTKPKPKKKKKCGRCKENHPYGQCPAFHKRCFVCDKMGHLAKCCRNRIDLFGSDTEEEDEEELLDYIGTITVDTVDKNLLEAMEAAFTCFQQQDDEETTHIIRQTPDSSSDVPKTSEETGKTEMCGVCFSKPQNGLFVHNNIAHVYGCYDCAKKIFDTNGNCPICRRKTFKVTKLFVS